MDLATAATGVCVASVAAMLVTTGRGLRRPEWVLKPVAATSFVVAALAHGALSTTYGKALLAGLAFSWLGDVLLISRKKPMFLAGLVAFLFGHVAYTVGFALRGISWPTTLGAAALVAVVAVFVSRWLLPSVEGPMKGPVLAYMVVISIMVALAAGTVAAFGNAFILVGAVAFYASDISVARDRFVAPGFGNKTWGWPLYFGAQLVFAWCAGRP